MPNNSPSRLLIAKRFFTHNRVDFENLAQAYFEQNKNHHGIIIAARHLPNEIAQKLLTVLNETTADEMINQIRYV